MSYIDSESAELAHFGQTMIQENALSWIGQKTTWHSKPAVAVVIKDVTDVLLLERSQAESRFKNVLLRSVSHELKTPTNGILHSVQAIAQEKFAPTWVKEKLEIAEVSCKHLLLLIEDLLDFSQLLSKKFRLTNSFFNIRKVLSDCMQLMSLMAQKKKISLELNVDPLVPETVNSDMNRLSQVLLNLLSNAVKFTHKKGIVKVMAVLTDDLKLEISVHDTGIGIAPEDISRLFHAFSCIDNSANLNPQGTGLGLHISNMLAKQLGSTAIAVESTVNKGSRFSFRVDFHQASRPLKLVFSKKDYSCEDQECPVQKVPSLMNKARKYPPILVVDDSPFNRQALVDIISQLSFACGEACTGKEAYEYVVKRAQEGFPVKLIIMDFEMPEMNGPTAAAAIKAECGKLGWEAPKVIAHTAYSAEEDIKLCLDSGMVDYLPKPSPRDSIVAMILKYLS
mmetsp:Transcript_12322/g.23389  ORF Transcript_12322/g.23389 Transcript_12322/m.23389 type:complete len:452 (+) Transcript_12322:148-1503(+)